VSTAGGTLVAIGVGNVLLGDDGAGVRVIDGLRREVAAGRVALPPDTRLVDGGTLGLELLSELDGARGLVLVDAGSHGDPPGTVTVHRGGDAIRVATAGDSGESGVGELVALAGLLRVLPQAMSVVEIEVDEIIVGTELSPAVASAMPDALEAARRELVAMGSGAREAGPRWQVKQAGVSA
jgi:hydrogenase maturation protease